LVECLNGCCDVIQAANWGSDECVRLLLSRSANPNAVDGLWRTPLMLAAMHAHKAAVVMQTLIDAGMHWRRGKGGGSCMGNCCLPHKFHPVGKFTFCRQILFQISGKFCGNFGAKLIFRAPIISSIGNLQPSVKKLQLCAPF